MQAHKLRPGSLNKHVRHRGVRREGRGRAGAGRGSRRRAYAPPRARVCTLVLERVTREINERYPATKDSNPTVVGLRTFGARRVALARRDAPVSHHRRQDPDGVRVQERGDVHRGGARARLHRTEGGGSWTSSRPGPRPARRPPSALNLVMYTQARAMMSDIAQAQGREVTPFETFLAGAIAGGIATFATHPPDVLRTRRSSRDGRPSRKRRGGGVKAVGRIHAEDREADAAASGDVESVGVRREESGRTSPSP